MDKLSEFILSLPNGDHILTNDEVTGQKDIYKVDVSVTRGNYITVIKHGFATAVICNITGTLVSIYANASPLPLLSENMKFHLNKILSTAVRIIPPKKTLVQKFLGLLKP